MTMLPDLVPVYPEILLAVGSMMLLMLGVFQKENATSSVSGLSVVLLLAAAVLLVMGPEGKVMTFGTAFVLDPFAKFMKIVTLVGSAVIILMSGPYIEKENMNRFEYPVLIVIATLGMMMMISASDMIALYMGLELQSLALYVLAAFKRNSQRATEAGLKYFVLGALSSGMLLYGASMLYGFTGSVAFGGIASHVAEQGAELGVIIGLVFVSAGLAFKISAVPFHMWTPDVYEGAPTPVTAFFATAPKMAAMALIIRVMVDAFGTMQNEWQQILVFVAIASMALGAFAAISQTNIKRMMAYSSIGHMGYALVGLATGTLEGITSVLVYMSIYLVMNAGAFVCILSMRRSDGMVENISDLAGLWRSRPGMAAALAILMFSLAGIPPLAGFLGKFYVFKAAIEAGMIPLAVIGLLTSVVGAFYYIRIVKVIYMDEPAEPFVANDSGAHRAILIASTAFTLLYIAMPLPLVEAARVAASSLF